MVLSDSTIIDYITAQQCIDFFKYDPPIIEPFEPENLGPASYDIRIGDTYLIPKTDTPVTLCEDEIEYETAKDCYSFFLKPGEFVLATTMETVNLPNDVCCEVKSRSSVRRAGLSICADAGFCDPGFSGKITLELKNDSKYPIEIKTGTRVGQLIFFKVDYRCHQSYSGKYQNQTTTTGSLSDGKIN